MTLPFPCVCVVFSLDREASCHLSHGISGSRGLGRRSAMRRIRERVSRERVSKHTSTCLGRAKTEARLGGVVRVVFYAKHRLSEMMVPLIRRTPRITAKSGRVSDSQCVFCFSSPVGEGVCREILLGSVEFLHHEEVWACWSSLDYAVGPGVGVGGCGFSLRSLSAPSSSLADSTSAF